MKITSDICENCYRMIHYLIGDGANKLRVAHTGCVNKDFYGRYYYPKELAKKLDETLKKMFEENEK